MATNELIVDDDYLKSMGTYFVKQGEQLDKLISEYISVLKEVKSKAIVSGDVANALSSYITYAEKLNKQIGNVSTTAKKQIDGFVAKIDAADQYLF